MPALPMPEEMEAAPAMMEEPEGMESSEEFRELLMQRIAGLSPEEKAQLDELITPEVAGILSRVLPELGDIIERVAGGGEGGEPTASPGGALGSLSAAPPPPADEEEAPYEAIA